VKRCDPLRRMAIREASLRRRRPLSAAVEEDLRLFEQFQD
jgi:hypothetical protein